MPLQPAFETTLRHGNHAVTLRASLRAAVTLDNLPGGIPGAGDSLMRQSYTGIRQVLLATATDQAAALSLLASLSGKPLAPFLGPAQAACLDLLQHLLPEPDAAPEAPAPVMVITTAEHLTNLFTFGTVIVGWPPAEVWTASPRELTLIATAYYDRQERIADAMSGKRPGQSAEQRQANIDAGLDPEFDRHGLQALKARHSA